MSVIAMSQVAYARRNDTPPPQAENVPSMNETAHGREAPNDALTSALGAVVAYFPSEVNILYTAIIAAISGTQTRSLSGQWAAFWLVLALTPLTVWLLYAARVRATGKPLPLAPRVWPTMEMVFALISFAVWAAALPGSPFHEFAAYSAALAGIAVLVVTFLLGLVAPVLGRTIKAERRASGNSTNVGV